MEKTFSDGLSCYICMLISFVPLSVTRMTANLYFCYPMVVMKEY